MSALREVLEGWSMHSALRELDRLEASAAAWEFLARAHELREAGLWGVFCEANRDLVSALERKVAAA